MKKQTIDREKVFTTHMSDKGCVLRMFTELLQSIIKRQTSQ